MNEKEILVEVEENEVASPEAVEHNHDHNDHTHPHTHVISPRPKGTKPTKSLTTFLIEQKGHQLLKAVERKHERQAQRYDHQLQQLMALKKK
jgi:hypothetical protein